MILLRCSTPRQRNWPVQIGLHERASSHMRGSRHHPWESGKAKRSFEKEKGRVHRQNSKCHLALSDHPKPANVFATDLYPLGPGPSNKPLCHSGGNLAVQPLCRQL